jgi:Tol biopolymer transport system component
MVPAGVIVETVFGIECLQTHLLAFQRVSPRGDTDICVLDPEIGEASVTCLTGGQDDPEGDAADDVHPTWGPSFTEIIFASDRDGDFELFSRDMFTGEVTQLTHNTAYDSEPDYYVTGGKVLFTSDRAGNKDIWLLELEESGNLESQLTIDPAPDFNPAWAYDSGVWLFTSTRQGDQDIWRGGAGPIGQQTLGPWNDDDVAWAPPNFFFASDRNGTWDVFRESQWTGREVLLDSPSEEYGPTPDPESLWVAFSTNKDGNFEIYKKHLITGELVRLTANASDDSKPAWFAWLF